MPFSISLNNNQSIFKLLFSGLIVLTLSGIFSLQGQGVETEFGKNRVQYHDFQWSFYESENFIVYFYQGGQELSKYTLNVAESEIDFISYQLEYQMGSKIEFLVYHNLSDLKQTNIGIGADFSNIGGVTKIVGNKVFIYYNGDRDYLERQIKAGIARVMLDNIVFGSNIQEVLQNAVLLNLPDWFTNGLIAYLSRDWDAEMEEAVYQGIRENRFKKFNKLTGDDATTAGFSFWNYIAKQYGVSNIPNILYLTRVNRNVESGFIFVLGKQLRTLENEWRAYNEALFTEVENTREVPEEEDVLLKIKDKRRDLKITDVNLNPKSDQLAFALSDNGKHKVYIYDPATGKKTKILRLGYRAFNLPNEENYPLLAWSPSGRKLLLIYEKKDQIQYMLYDVESGESEVQEINKFQQIMDVAFLASEQKVIFSAMKKGVADLFTFTFKNQKTQQLIDDQYDDIDPIYYNDGENKGIIFSSNRPDDTLRTNIPDSAVLFSDYDLFFYDLQKESVVLSNLTDTDFGKELAPKQFDEKHFSFLSDENGIQNFYVGEIEKKIAGSDKLVFFKDSVVANPTYPLDSLMAAGLIDSVANRDIYRLEARTMAVSDRLRNIKEYSVSNTKLAELGNWEKGTQIFLKEKLPADEMEGRYLKKSPFIQQVESRLPAGSENDILYQAPNSTEQRVPVEAEESLGDPDDIDIDAYQFGDVEKEQTETDSTDQASNYFFQSEFDFWDTDEEDSPLLADAVESNDQKKTKKKNPDFRKSRIRVYSPRFATDYVVTQLDNSTFLTPYQSYSLQFPGNFSTKLNGLTRMGISDLMEDYKIVAGFRMPFDFRISEYYIKAQFLKKRLDKEFLVYRKAKKEIYAAENIEPFEGKNLTYIGQVSLKYPFQMVNSLRAHFSYRNETLRVLSIDPPTLSGFVSDQLSNGIDLAQDWGIFKLEYIYDDTDQLLLNIMRGTRYKIYYEIFKPFDITTRNGFNLDIKDTGNLMVFGFDFRHYKQLHRQIIWATRLTAAKSWGTAKMIYFLGGVENWINPDPASRFDFDNEIDQEENYAFQSIAANLRGFKQNIRHGSNYAIINTEVRVPVFSYLFSSPIRSDFFRNFQVIGFADIGTAWEGWNPFSRENLFDINVDNDGPVLARIEYFRQPVIAGYGFGLRSTVLGYFVKADAAWGWNGELVSEKPVWYISLGMDF